MSLRRRVAQMERALRTSVTAPLVLFAPHPGDEEIWADRICQAKVVGRRVIIIRLSAEQHKSVPRI